MDMEKSQMPVIVSKQKYYTYVPAIVKGFFHGLLEGMPRNMSEKTAT
jgi:hypothetical protein